MNMSSPPPQTPASANRMHQHGSSVSPLTSPCPSRRATITRKRPAEDNSQFANAIARSIKLQKTDHDELIVFSKLSPAEQSIWLAARSLKLSEQQTNLNPPDLQVVYNIPKKIESKIVQQSSIIIMDPSISAYLTGEVPVKILLELFEKNSSWGLDATIQEDKSKYDTIVSRIRKKFTGHRNIMKVVIGGSLGKVDSTDELGKRRIDAQNIVDLCDEILVKSHKKSKLVVTVPLCARVAYLRAMYTEPRTFSIKDQKELTYWEDVDLDLSRARTAYDTPKKLSKYFAIILKRDRALYGDTNLDNLPTESSSAAAGAPPAMPPQTPTAAPQTPAATRPATTTPSADSGSEASP
ncbi:uncharacterized protein LACBIDRAFT_302464 [Laccaria bicolor S238N-H82]|uniref:Predicted protein n=1 Tax=Laccaria bicolor (strain S238N-H82 / ATCC MYA-4686) TaxID=486041 RepID=B0DHP7_LACBS|nr:uncharacterized protein LACBIDRAFT_302464 [Laccaria bicolor S238N-H82]EDR05763.1 predicted protein [Laccaria bicolor S238N-H82]|eukprot:XP_001883439.1 predicted protein [Laccaria bicolor S238N-H82]